MAEKEDMCFWDNTEHHRLEQGSTAGMQGGQHTAGQEEAKSTWPDQLHGRLLPVGSVCLVGGGGD